MTILDFVRLSRHNILWILGCIALGAIGAYGYTLTKPVLYAATSTGYVAAGSSNNVNDGFSGSSLATQKAMSYVPLANSRSVGQAIKDDLGLPDDVGAIAASVSVQVLPGTVLMKFTAISESPQKAQQIANAAVEATSDEAAKLEELNTPGVPSVIKIVPIESALLPGSPVSPNLERNLAIGALAGLVLGYVVAFLRRALDNRVRHMPDVETMTKKGVLGLIPVAAELAKQRKQGRLSDLGIASESIRQLRTNLRFVQVDTPPRSIVVTSANPGEGKSTVSTNLARVLAESGEKTVLIDADLRRPMLATAFGVDGQVGLTQLLAGDVSLSEVMQDSGTPKLGLIPAGRIPPNPSELLGSQRMQQVIAQLSENYLVVMDAPPLLPVTDAGLLAAHSDGVILVLRTGKTYKEQLALCVKVLQQVGATLLGTVLNMVPKRGMGTAVYGYGHGGYRQHQYYYDQSGKRGARKKPKSHAA